MKIAVASDHGGFELKEKIKEFLQKENYDVVDYGTDSLESCDYPTFAYKAAKAVQCKQADLGIVCCTTGEGVSITCNKLKNIRCGLVYNLDTSRLIKEHNDCNMMALGAKYTSSEDALKYVESFIKTPFSGGRHQRRVDLIKKYEEE